MLLDYLIPILIIVKTIQFVMATEDNQEIQRIKNEHRINRDQFIEHCKIKWNAMKQSFDYINANIAYILKNAHERGDNFNQMITKLSFRLTELSKNDISTHMLCVTMEQNVL